MPHKDTRQKNGLLYHIFMISCFVIAFVVAVTRLSERSIAKACDDDHLAYISGTLYSCQPIPTTKKGRTYETTTL